MRLEIISPTHNLSKYERKLGPPCILKSYNGFCIGMFLHMYVMYYKSSHARMRILTDAHSVINGQKKVNKVSKCLKKCAKYDDRENLAILRCEMQVRAKTRTHAHVRVFLQNA